jgi:cysteine-rich repeat protein
MSKIPPLRKPPASARYRRVSALGLLLVAVGACGTLESRELEPLVVGDSGAPGAGGLGGSSGSGTKGGTGGSGAKGGNTGKGGTAGNGAGGAPIGGEAGTGGMPDEAVCGDGDREGSEECDDHNENSGDGCSASCRSEPAPATCGDGKKDEAENCDDGNLGAGDGCDSECRKERCGNSHIDAGENCDPPSTGHCTTSCHLVSANCGDGEVQADEGEDCDDGNEAAGDGCFECVEECGDGRIDAALGEDCEPQYSPDLCTEDCHWAPVCGDTIVETEVGEECDPSNGITCVACKLVTPSCEDTPQGCGGGPSSCIPDASASLVQNGGFTSDASGWTAESGAVHLDVVEDGSPTPRALEVTMETGPVRAQSGAYQCLPVQGGRQYELAAQYKIPSDTAAGVGAAIVGFLYAGTQCSGSWAGASLRGPQGLVRGEWTDYSYQLDTSALPGNGSPARLLLRVDAVRPAGVAARVLWDSIALNEAGGERCGDCSVSDGETCDDGNLTAGDGCSTGCQFERCGDRIRSLGEACDDGNSTYESGDACTPACRLPSSCDLCAASTCAPELEGCFALEGEAEEGPAAGTARSTLCDRLLTCVRRTGCDLAMRETLGVSGAFMENCFCGTSGDHCFDGEAEPNGSCADEVTAALETASPGKLLARFDGNIELYPVFEAARDLLACEDTSCSAACGRAPACGDGLVQDRNLDLAFVVDHVEVPCSDELTATGKGCSFEECDDGNQTKGDGCDQYCLLETCGNYLVQAGEQCDDGNRVSGDGCRDDCHAEYVCGNGTLEPPFEKCDEPLRAGAVCTQPQSESSPDDCACDADCQLVVCGDDAPQAPFEDCDPPNGFSCGDDCKFLATSPCRACIAADPDFGGFQTEFCDTQPACVTLENCVVAKQCFSPVAGACWCGTTDIDSCLLPSFPFPPTSNGLNCVPEYQAAYDNPTSNADAIDRMFIGDTNPDGSYLYPGYPAMGILNAIASGSAPACFDDCL